MKDKEIEKDKEIKNSWKVKNGKYIIFNPDNITGHKMSDMLSGNSFLRKKLIKFLQNNETVRN